MLRGFVAVPCTLPFATIPFFSVSDTFTVSPPAGERYSPDAANVPSAYLCFGTTAASDVVIAERDDDAGAESEGFDDDIVSDGDEEAGAESAGFDDCIVSDDDEPSETGGVSVGSWVAPHPASASVKRAPMTTGESVLRDCFMRNKWKNQDRMYAEETEAYRVRIKRR